MQRSARHAGVLSQEHNKKNIREGKKKQSTMYVYYTLYSHDVGCAATSNTPCRARLKKEKNKHFPCRDTYYMDGLLCCLPNRDFFLPAVMRPMHTRQRAVCFSFDSFCRKGLPAQLRLHINIDTVAGTFPSHCDVTPPFRHVATLHGRQLGLSRPLLVPLRLAVTVD